ncbi:hypothetical protein SARC_06629 [Sphaeroforma arctica JP610]|uniref:Major facilitator superfamily (MFS) profile domain-containing protein n=1 Tax=Sphaeroforma arctica JP610 TaxID=667725 RepID=A0A0L0FWU9_9EUKA|nr:hypothetical protein SARC_06629 [Sphaeroforma arctica JP610]KNC81036.1 hypothetical protein SARC_06629 [Sphaeroforma arctica JP610]|eukprot:XP_014154938.1 hypothetical protein SARC_06629 [Sphaeroforma arctica JP610]
MISTSVDMQIVSIKIVECCFIIALYGHAKGCIELDSDGLYAFFRDAKECIGVRSYLFSTLGFTAVTYATGALGLWGPKFIVDGTAHTPSPMSTAEASMMLGGVTAVNGVVGTICGAVLGAWLAKYSERADPLVCGLGLAVAGPFCALALQFFQHNVTLAWVFIFISEFGLCLNWALNAAILLSVIAPNRRSTAEAIQILLSHIFGDALSPYAVGIATDALVNKGISRPDAMRISLQSCSAVAILGSLCFLLCAIYYPRDKSRVKKQERAE